MSARDLSNLASAGLSDLRIVDRPVPHRLRTVMRIRCCKFPVAIDSLKLRAVFPHWRR